MAATLSALVVLTTLALAPAPKSQVAVMSVQDAPAPSAFIESLRIQLTGMAIVDTGPILSAAPDATKVAQAREYLARTGASIAVWAERRPVPASNAVEIVVLAVTREPSGATIEVARVPASGGPEDDRILALKVGELLHRVLSLTKSEQDLAAALANNLPPPDPRPPPIEAKERAAPPPPKMLPWGRVRGFLEVGGGVRFASKLVNRQEDGALFLGAAYGWERWRAEAFGGLRRFTNTTTDASVGRVTVSEYEGALGVRAVLLVGSVRVGADVELDANWLSASGTATDGRTGSARKTAYSLALGPELRLGLAPSVELKGMVRLEGTLYAQRFAVLEVPVTAFSGLRAAGELALVLWTP